MLKRRNPDLVFGCEPHHDPVTLDNLGALRLRPLLRYEPFKTRIPQAPPPGDPSKNMDVTPVERATVPEAHPLQTLELPVWAQGSETAQGQSKRIPALLAPTPLKPQSKLKPYSGHRLDRLQNLGQAWSQSIQDTDRSGMCTYSFNTLGFRGQELDDTARCTIFIFGESDAFGIGVNIEESWPYLVAREWAQSKGVAAEATCIMNFAEGGASNAAIARSVLTQCAALKPDLVLINFAANCRTEGFAEGRAFPIGPWHEGLDPVEAASAAPQADGLRERVQDQVTRGQAYLQFCAKDQGLYDSLRDILLVQYSLALDGIPAVAISREPGHLNRVDVFGSPVLGPLVARLDKRFFAMHIAALELTDTVDWNEDGFHYGPITHQAVADRVLIHARGLEAKPVQGTSQARNQDHAEVSQRVREFYSQIPSNFPAELQSQAKSIRKRSLRYHYADLHQYLLSRKGEGPCALDVGCGGGWLAHAMGYTYGFKVKGIDFAPETLNQARELGPILGTNALVQFETADLFEYERPADTQLGFDIVTCIGVLHQVADPLAALERLVSHVAPGGHIFLGIYHEPGRRVFNAEMRRILEQDGKEAAYAFYRSLRHIHSKDEDVARFWFQDQVLPPHESQHTLEEVWGWFDALGLSMVNTSIGLSPWMHSRADLIEAEQDYERRARKALFSEKRYFPGYFTVFGRRDY